MNTAAILARTEAQTRTKYRSRLDELIRSVRVKKNP
jgi:hypothetical protein